MSISRKEKLEVIERFKKHDSDTGSSAVQIAILTSKIKNITEHLKINKKDNHSRRGLLLMVGQRKRLLNYVKKNNVEEYKGLLQQLGIRR